MTTMVRAVALAAALAATACSGQPITETPFAQTASEAASLLAAASKTIGYVHDQPDQPARLTIEYASAALFNYAELVTPVPQELPTLAGAPSDAEVQQLLDLLEPAVADLNAPCVHAGCDWQSQVVRIDAAKEALLEAAE